MTVDFGNTVYTDNTTSTTFISTLAHYADLTAGNSLVVTSPASPQSGTQVTINWQDQNAGDAAVSGAFTDNVLVQRRNADNSLTTVATSSVSGNSSLAARASSPQTFQFTLPDGDNGVGMFQVSVTVDSSRSVKEYDSAGSQDYGNNVATVNLNSQRANYPLLLVQNLIVTPSSPVSGNIAIVSWKDANTGNGDVTSFFFDSVNVVNTTTGQTVVNDVVVSGPIAAGGFATESYPIQVPDGAAGTVTLKITVTANATKSVFVYDPNYDPKIFLNGNTAALNEATSSLNVTAVPAPYPDLIVSGVSGPAHAIYNQQVLVTWTDKNQGAAPASGSWVDNLYLATDATGGNARLLGSFPYAAGLDKGASVQRSELATLPSVIGTYWFVVVTNATQTVKEGTNPGSNTSVAAASIDIEPVLLPDLLVSNITTTPSPASSGKEVSVSFMVTNVGTAPTSVPVWQDWVILSQDATLGQGYDGSNDQVFYNQPAKPVGKDNQSYLGPSQHGVSPSYSQSVNVTLPINAQGTWYAYVIADGTGNQNPAAMPESNHINNLLMAPFSVALSPAPELVVTSVQTSPPPKYSGQPCTVTWTLLNKGSGATVNSWTDYVYMSLNRTLDGNAIKVGTFVHTKSLAAGSSDPDSAIVTLPVNVPGLHDSGSDYFLVQTDVNGEVLPNDLIVPNFGATPAPETVQLTSPPDLQVTQISAPAPSAAAASYALKFSYSVKNAGAGATVDIDPSNSSWRDSFYLSPTQTYYPSTARLFGQDIHQGPLQPQASYSNTVTKTIPSDVPLGTYYLFVVTDSAGAVFEDGNIANNLNASPPAIQVVPVPADLVVLSASAPSTAAAGSAIVVTWTTTNQGVGDTAVSSWQDNVYADNGPTLTNNKKLLGSYTHVGLMGAGGFYTQSQLVTLPINLQAQDLFVVTDATNMVVEGDTSKTTSAPLPISINQSNVSDLQVSTVTAPTAALTGGPLAVSWTVVNSGLGTTNADYWYDDVWLSTKTTLGPGQNDIYLGTVQHNNRLTPAPSSGSSYTVLPTSFNLPNADHMTAGIYYVIVATDRPVAPPGNSQGVNLVGESNETNNQAHASAQTTISVALSPKLTVGLVTAPPTAVSGGQISVSWTVTNSGAATPTVPITDSVFLSLGPFLDPSARYLDSAEHLGGLAAGGSYTQSMTLILPPSVGTFYVIVETNSDHSVYEPKGSPDPTNNSPTPVVIQVPLAADLKAGTITVQGQPASVQPGQNVTIAYTVNNIGNKPAYGSWYDAIYVSSTPTGSAADPLLDRRYEMQNVAAFTGNYQDQFTVPLPAMAPGPIYIILRTNILGNFPEVNPDNNQSASTPMNMDAQPLALGAGVIGTLTQGQSGYYRVVVGAGQTLGVALNSQSLTAANELYVSYGTMPTRSQYDYRFGPSLKPNQQITVPVTQAGNYYVLAYADGLPDGPEAYTLTASRIQFSVTDFSPAVVGKGKATIEIQGAKFDGGTTFQLLGPGDPVVGALSVPLEYSTDAFVTFDLTNSPVGTYYVQAKQADGSTTPVLSKVLTLAAAAPRDVSVHLETPDAVFPGHQGTVTVNYVNPGNTDVAAPLIGLAATNGLLTLADQNTLDSNTAVVWLLGTSFTGPAGILRPGERGSIQVSFQATDNGQNNVAFQLTVEPADATDLVDAVAAGAQARPPGLSDASWNAKWTSFYQQAGVGPTWGGVVRELAQDATQLAAQGSVDFYSATTVFGYAIYGSLAQGPLPLPVPPNAQAVAAGATPIVTPVDPNNIIGPQGSGSNNCVAPEDPLPYQIIFTNVGTSPAQTVHISDPIDESLDGGTFQMQSFGFDGMTVTVPPEGPHSIRVPVPDSDLDVIVSWNIVNGVATFDFVTVGHSSGQLPSSANVGFLASVHTDPTAFGFVSYKVTPKSAVKNDTRISAHATVTFNNQTPEDTPVPWIFNTVEAAAGLSSRVLPLLSAVTTSPTFMVSWTGSDDPNSPGVATYTIFVSDNGGQFIAIPALTGTALTSATYSGTDGHRYAFYSVATDNAGNQELEPVMPQTSTTIDTLPTSRVADLPANSYNGFSVSWSGSHDNGIAIASYAIYVSDGTGQPILWRTELMPGSFPFTTGTVGHKYTFYSVAKDAVGQLSPSSASTSTTIVDPPAHLVVSVQGGNTVVAGNSFLLTAQLTDQFGNPVSSYNGPPSITASASPGDPQGNFPIDAQVSDSGLALFVGNLQTAGSYTLTAAGSSVGVTVTPADTSYFTVSAPVAASTGSGFDVTVKATDSFGNTAPGYAGTIKLTSSDPLVPTPVASYTFLPGDNGSHVFHNVTLNSAGSQTITATQTSPMLAAPITGTSGAITTRGLTVTSLTPTSTGFKVSFSKPFVPANVTLYGPGATIQDVILSGATHGSIGGSLIVDPSGTSAEFKATANTLSFFNGGSSVVLPDDQYTVTLVSGVSNGFSDGTAGLDGGGRIGGNGGHANFVFTFPATGTTHYESAATPVLAIPDFARGPNDGATIQIPIVGQSTLSSGIPITLYNAAGVTDVSFTLTYNPALFLLNAASTSILDSTGTGTKTFTRTSSGTGTATFHYTNTVAQSAGALILGDILATDPSSSKTSYGVKDLMTLGSITVNGSAFTGVAANGIHVNTYFGDVSGDGRIDAVDVAKMVVVSAAAPGVDTGFVAYEQLDPAIVGDVANDVSIDAGDLSTFKGFLLHQAAPLMSTTLGLTGIVSPNAADPIVSLANAMQTTNNGIVSVPVMLDHPHPAGSTGVSEAVLALTYDPSVLSVSASDITLGSLPGKDWTLITDVDARTGQIGIQLFSMTPITATQGGSLVNIAFHVLHGATLGATAVRLVDTVTPNGKQYGTMLADDQSGLVLSPGIDRVIINTGVAPAAAPAPASTEHVAERQILAVSEETSSSAVLGSESGVGLAFISNGAVAGETIHVVPADLVVSGALAFQTNMATPMRAGQIFQLGSAPALNSLLFANSPGQLAADRLFLALARGTDALAEYNSLGLFNDKL